MSALYVYQDMYDIELFSSLGQAKAWLASFRYPAETICLLQLNFVCYLLPGGFKAKHLYHQREY